MVYKNHLKCSKTTSKMNCSMFLMFKNELSCELRTADLKAKEPTIEKKNLFICFYLLFTRLWVFLFELFFDVRLAQINCGLFSTV